MSNVPKLIRNIKMMKIRLKRKELFSYSWISRVSVFDAGPVLLNNRYDRYLGFITEHDLLFFCKISAVLITFDTPHVRNALSKKFWF